MRGLAFPALILFLALTQQPAQQHKDWRGILPLHSTRTDVERLLGPPSPPPKDGIMAFPNGEGSSCYFIENQVVRIAFVTNTALEQAGCSSFPLGTVIGVEVYLKDRPSLSDLQIDLAKFETLDPSTPPNIGFKAYIDSDDGLDICTQDGRVNKLVYYGDARDRQPCPKLAGNPKEFCNLTVDFLPRQEEQKKH
jgi:hypothetical protein